MPLRLLGPYIYCLPRPITHPNPEHQIRKKKEIKILKIFFGNLKNDYICLSKNKIKILSKNKIKIL